jgi:hypothetical protein
LFQLPMKTPLISSAWSDVQLVIYTVLAQAIEQNKIQETVR